MQPVATHAAMQPPAAFASALFRAVGTFASQRGGERALLIVMYHQVLTAPDPLRPSEPDRALFAAQVELLATHFNVLSLAEAAARLRAGTLPPRALSITFDDGYADNLTVALPVLAARRLPATVFVAPGYLDGGRMFNDTVIESVRHSGAALDLRDVDLPRYELSDVRTRLAAIKDILGRIKYLEPGVRSDVARQVARGLEPHLPTTLMMTREQVRELHAAGIEIGAHTLTHPILASVTEAQASAEIGSSKRELEALIDAPVRSFAYPNGRPHQDFNATHVRIVRDCGFEQAVSTASGSATARSDLFQLPRVAPWDTTTYRYLARLVAGYRGAGAIAEY